MRLIIKALLTLCATPLLASTWTSDQPLLLTQPGTPTTTVLSVSADNQGGHRAVVARSDDRVELLHLDRNQQLLSASPRLEGTGVFAPSPRSRLVELEDGSLFALTDTLLLARLEANGDVAWARQQQFGRCLRALASPGAILWSICRDRRDDYALQRTDAVGRTRILSELPIGLMTALSPAADQGVYYANYLGSASIGRFAADGSRRWYVTPTTLDDVVVEGIHELDNGHVLLVGRFVNDARLRLMERDQQGLLVGFTDLPLDFESREILVSRRESDGSLLLLFDRARLGADVLMQIKADRSLGWLYALPEETEVHRTDLGRHALLRTDGLETRLITSRYMFIDGEGRLDFRYQAIGADGQLRIDVPLGDNQMFKDFEPRPVEGDFLSAGRYARIDGDGQISDLALPPRYDGQEQPKVLAAYSEGTLRLVVVDTVAERRMQAWTRDGQLRWSTPLQRDFALFAQSAAFNADLLVADQAACFAILEYAPNGNQLDPYLDCVRRDDGSALARLPIEPFFGIYRVPILLDGGIVVSQHASDGVATVRFRSVLDGAEVRPSRALQGELVGSSGGLGVYFPGAEGIEAHWFDGQQPESVIIPNAASLPMPAAISAEGLIIGSSWFPRDGTAAVDLAPQVGLVVEVNVDAIPLVVHSILADGQHALAGFDPGTASLRWSQVIAAPQSLTNYRMARGAGHIHFLSGSGSDVDIDLDIIVYDRQDGQMLDRRSADCEGPPCRWFVDGRTVSSEGLDLLLVRQSLDAPSAVRAVHQAAIQPSTQADQAGIGGLWYHPGLQGHGFVLTYVPESRTLFAPWFTYGDFALQGDESDLRWYSLQGQAEPGNNFARLDILLNGGGNFDATPVTTPQVIGEATLHLASCDRATLALRFDQSVFAEQPAQIPLLRLGARTRPCLSPDGTVEPPALTAPDQAGFSIRQSGAWFDPNTSGQGLMLEVIPPSPTQAGLLFGAWFTYDRAGLANDFDAQDWFILQADLASAADGRVRVPIYRSTGGELLERPTGNLFVVGEAELQFSDCDQLRVDYQFIEHPHAGVHGGLQGQLNLQRIGACVSP